MNRSRDKRLTVRFRSDDPAIAELYTTLQQKRRTTRKTMNTLVLNALQVAFGVPDLVADLCVGDSAVATESLEGARADVQFLHHHLTINPILEEGSLTQAIKLLVRQVIVGLAGSLDGLFGIQCHRIGIAYGVDLLIHC